MSNRMDRVTLVNNIVKFKIQCNTSAPFNILRNQMKLFLIEEILKSHHERRDEMILQRLRTETVELLKILDPEDRKRKKNSIHVVLLVACSETQHIVKFYGILVGFILTKTDLCVTTD